MIKEKIATNLEQAFSESGFAELSVAKLKATSGVSLRTLYKHFPSKESMVVGALEHRHQRYLDFLTQAMPTTRQQAIEHCFSRLVIWMQQFAPHGCLSSQALAAFPDNEQITTAVKQHKADVQRFLSEQSQSDTLGKQLFVLHEGLTAAWPVIGDQAIDATFTLLHTLMETPKHA